MRDTLASVDPAGVAHGKATLRNGLWTANGKENAGNVPLYRVEWGPWRVPYRVIAGRGAPCTACIPRQSASRRLRAWAPRGVANWVAFNRMCSVSFHVLQRRTPTDDVSDTSGGDTFWVLRIDWFQSFPFAVSRTRARSDSWEVKQYASDLCVALFHQNNHRKPHRMHAAQSAHIRMRTGHAGRDRLMHVHAFAR